jgi:hypothetical protein
MPKKRITKRRFKAGVDLGGSARGRGEEGEGLLALSGREGTLTAICPPPEHPHTHLFITRPNVTNVLLCLPSFTTWKILERRRILMAENVRMSVMNSNQKGSTERRSITCQGLRMKATS